MFKFNLPLKLLVRDKLSPPFSVLTDSSALAVLLLSLLSLKFSSFIDNAEGECCMDRETGMLVKTLLASKLPEALAIVGSFVLEMGTMLKVAEVSVGLVVTVKGNDSVVIFVVTGMAANKEVTKERDYK